MSVKGKLRNWRTDWRIAEEFCEKYGLGYLDGLANREPYSVLFFDADGDEICCCISKNTEKSFDKEMVDYEDIIHYIPLNELDLKTDLHQVLFDYCSENGIITISGVFSTASKACEGKPQSSKG